MVGMLMHHFSSISFSFGNLWIGLILLIAGCYIIPVLLFHFNRKSHFIIGSLLVSGTIFLLFFPVNSPIAIFFAGSGIKSAYVFRQIVPYLRENDDYFINKFLIFKNLTLIIVILTLFFLSQILFGANIFIPLLIINLLLMVYGIRLPLVPTSSKNTTHPKVQNKINLFIFYLLYPAILYQQFFGIFFQYMRHNCRYSPLFLLFFPLLFLIFTPLISGMFNYLRKGKLEPSKKTKSLMGLVISSAGFVYLNFSPINLKTLFIFNLFLVVGFVLILPGYLKNDMQFSPSSKFYTVTQGLSFAGAGLMAAIFQMLPSFFLWIAALLILLAILVVFKNFQIFQESDN